MDFSTLGLSDRIKSSVQYDDYVKYRII